MQSNHRMRFFQNAPLFSGPERLYDSHVITTDFQKMVLAVGSSLMGLSDPYRADMVAVSGEVTGKNALSYMHCRMKANTEGRLILKDRPTINTQTVDFDHLKSLAPNSLGHTYVKFCKKHNITPDSRDPVQYVDDEDLAYVMKRSGDCSILTGLVKWILY